MSTEAEAGVAPRRVSAVAIVVRVAGAGLVAANGLVHLKLYRLGYHAIDVIGPLFLLNAMLAFALAVALLVVPRRWLPWTAVAAGLFDAGTLAALGLSLTVGLFNFTETTQAPYVTTSVVVEATGAVLLLGYGAAALLRTRGRPVRGGGSWW